MRNSLPRERVINCRLFAHFHNGNSYSKIDELLTTKKEGFFTATENITSTPARTLFISGLKSRVIIIFELKNDGKKWSRIYFEIDSVVVSLWEFTESLYIEISRSDGPQKLSERTCRCRLDSSKVILSHSYYFFNCTWPF